MTNIKYDDLVEEIRTETKFLDELLKTDMEKYKRQYWYGYVSALKYVLERACVVLEAKAKRDDMKRRAGMLNEIFSEVK